MTSHPIDAANRRLSHAHSALFLLISYPPGEMNNEHLESLRKAGRIARDCREWARENIKPGVRLAHILETVEDMIAKEGAAPAFPAQTSRNHVTAHYCSAPGDEQIYEEGDCVKVDVGVHVDGWVADNACTVDLSTDGRWGELIKASEDALKAAIATVAVGVQVSEIGANVEAVIQARGFEPVRNLTGHGVARWKVHCAPQIPSYREGHERLRQGMIIAIEPFASTGVGMITERGKAEVFMLVRPPRKAKGLDKDLLNAIQAWRGLPIARRYFNEFSPQVLEDTLTKLARQGSLIRFPPLVESAGVMTAQTEHTMIVGDEGPEVITA
jgi:methionyl aminopeptidase